MKNLMPILLIIHIILSGIIEGQTVSQNIPLTVTDNSGVSKVLYFGLDDNATNGIDATLGEEELPPVPPTGVFDTRFIGSDIGIDLGQGIEKDYREGNSNYTGSKVHELQYQTGSGTTITISWDLPEGIVGKIEDLFGGIVVNADMAETGSVTVTNPSALNKLKMTINYSPIINESITLTSPNGGEEWESGSEHNITWTSSGVTTVNIVCSTDSGTNWLDVAPEVNAATGSYLWTIPDVTSSNCKVKISESTNGTPSDESDNVFQITQVTSYPPVIDNIPDQVIKNGEGFDTISLDNYVSDQDNEDNELAWTYSGNSELTINISSARIVTITVPNTEWTGSEKVTFTAKDPDNLSDEKEVTFTVEEVTEVELEIPISITDNSGGSKILYFGLDEYATDGIDAGLGEEELPPVPPTGVFDARFVGTDIEIDAGQGLGRDYREGGLDFIGTKTHELQFQVGSGSLITISWNLPDGITGELKDLFGGLVINENMEGDGSTTISNPGALNKLIMTINYSSSIIESITVLNPNGGDIWYKGAVASILWTSNLDEEISIDLYNGSDLAMNIDSSTANDGVYQWFIPNDVGNSNEYRIKISGVMHTDILDFSDNYFRIRDPRNIIVQSPNGGEIWRKGDTNSISWTDNIDENVEIVLYKNGIVNRIIQESTESDGNCDWIVTEDLLTGDDYKIRVSSVSESGVYDMSDSDFSISDQAYIQVLSPNGGESWQKSRKYAITWSDNIVDNVKIELYRESVLELLITDSVPSTGEYLWSVPIDLASGSNYKIRVCTVSGDSLDSFSNNVFSIIDYFGQDAVVSLPDTSVSTNTEILYPIRIDNLENVSVIGLNILYDSEVLIFNNEVENNVLVNNFNISHANSTIKINWINSLGMTLAGKIFDLKFFYKDSIANLKFVEQNYFANNVGTEYDVIFLDGSVKSRNISRTLTLQVPNGGESFPSGSEQEIKWTHESVESVNIEYSIDNDSIWIPVISNMGSNQLSYTWSVPETISSQCKIKISDAEYSEIYDISDNYFAITPTSVYNPESFPKQFVLYNNYPNPFNPTTQIKFALPEGVYVKIILYDNLGREIKTLINSYRNPGIYDIEFNAEELTSGIYFFRLITQKFSDTKKMLLIR